MVRGDRVQVIGDHAEKGKQGKVLQVIRKTDRLIVEGVNVKTMYVKGNPDRNIPGRAVTKERSIPSSYVNLADPMTNSLTRVTCSILEDGTKARVSKRSGAFVPKPEILRHRKRPVSGVITDKDTTEQDVWEITYEGFELPDYPPEQPET